MFIKAVDNRNNTRAHEAVLLHHKLVRVSVNHLNSECTFQIYLSRIAIVQCKGNLSGRTKTISKGGAKMLFWWGRGNHLSQILRHHVIFFKTCIGAKLNVFKVIP